MTPTTEPLRVVLVDDSGIFRHGLRLLLDTVGVTVVADLPDAGALPAAVEADRPDAVVLDVRPASRLHRRGPARGGALRDTYPTLGILMLSTYAEPRLVIRLLDTVPTGVGYLLKTVSTTWTSW